MKRRKNRFTPPGSSPGLSALHEAVEHVGVASITMVDFDADTLEERQQPEPSLWKSDIVPGKTRWLHIQGKPAPSLLRALAERYDLHLLALEDVVNTGQRPKLEIFDDWFFIILQRPVLEGETLRLDQMSIFLGDNCVISVYEGEENIVEPLRQRMRAGGTTRIRKLGADYLCYALADLTVDLCFPVLEQMGDRLHQLEEQVLQEPEPLTLEAVHNIKRELTAMRRAVMPQRDVINMLIREENPLMEERTRVYLRDCYDHMAHILDLLESYREMASGLHDLYLSALSQKMNDVMKVLTIIATIFIPLSFVVGLYGMNFNPEASPWNMPELNAYYGYPLLWLALLLIAGGMLVYFRVRRWF